MCITTFPTHNSCLLTTTLLSVSGVYAGAIWPSVDDWSTTVSDARPSLSITNSVFSDTGAVPLQGMNIYCLQFTFFAT